MKRQETYRRTVEFKGEGTYDLIEKAEKLCKERGQSFNQFIFDSVSQHVEMLTAETLQQKQASAATNICVCGHTADVFYIRFADGIRRVACKTCFDKIPSSNIQVWGKIKGV
jgi:peroxiredoxin family protein